MIKSYKDLTVWQKAMDLVVEVYALTKKLPKDELYALTNQMRRAAVSIPSNIAEGHSRNSTKEYIQFLAIAKGSSAELETQILLCVKIGYLMEVEIQSAVKLLDEVQKMIYSLIGKLRG